MGRNRNKLYFDIKLQIFALSRCKNTQHRVIWIGFRAKRLVNFALQGPSATRGSSQLPTELLFGGSARNFVSGDFDAHGDINIFGTMTGRTDVVYIEANKHLDLR
jgi:hypothetical protein